MPCELETKRPGCRCWLLSTDGWSLPSSFSASGEFRVSGTGRTYGNNSPVSSVIATHKSPRDYPKIPAETRRRPSRRQSTHRRERSLSSAATIRMFTPPINQATHSRQYGGNRVLHNVRPPACRMTNRTGVQGLGQLQRTKRDKYLRNPRSDSESGWSNSYTGTRTKRRIGRIREATSDTVSARSSVHHGLSPSTRTTAVLSARTVSGLANRCAISSSARRTPGFAS